MDTFPLLVAAFFSFISASHKNLHSRIKNAQDNLQKKAVLYGKSNIERFITSEYSFIFDRKTLCQVHTNNTANRIEWMLFSIAIFLFHFWMILKTCERLNEKSMKTVLNDSFLILLIVFAFKALIEFALCVSIRICGSSQD